jgi:hypothetical protein
VAGVEPEIFTYEEAGHGSPARRPQQFNDAPFVEGRTLAFL